MRCDAFTSHQAFADDEIADYEKATRTPQFRLHPASIIAQDPTYLQHLKIGREKSKLQHSYWDAIWVACLVLMGALHSLGFAGSGKVRSEYTDHALSVDKVAATSYIEGNQDPDFSVTT